jgi:hypothetical protein
MVPVPRHLAVVITASLLAAFGTASAQPDFARSYFVPQSGPLATPAEGASAYRFFRICPNNDGGTSLPNNARIKVVIRDATGAGIPGFPADEICILFNGGTAAQGFSGLGADSIIATSFWNPVPLCPDVRCLAADAPTDVNGVTYITFAGADPSNPGVAVRKPDRKWGHYDSAIPVFVSGNKLYGRVTTGSPLDSYTLRIKNIDLVGGLGTVRNAGAVVSSLDYNSMAWGITSAVDPTTYWRDLDDSGAANVVDMNILTAHYNHDCDTPNSP